MHDLENSHISVTPPNVTLFDDSYTHPQSYNFNIDVEFDPLNRQC